MFTDDRFASLQFDKNHSVHNQVGSKYPYVVAAKEYRYGNFAFSAQSSLCECDPHRFTVNRLQKARPELVIYVIKDANDSLRKVIVLPSDLSAAYIHVLFSI